MTFDHLDSQLQFARLASETPALTDGSWSQLATTVHREVASLSEASTNQLRRSVQIPPERYLEELTAFQRWMDFAHANATNPAIVRAQVMTELYVSFLWLQDSLMVPIAAVLPAGSVVSAITTFLGTGACERLREAVVHGRWCYLPDFSGLDCWTRIGTDQRFEHFEVGDRDLNAWQLLSRGTAIAALLALTEG
jgi:hypothetical protein